MFQSTMFGLLAVIYGRASSAHQEAPACFLRPRCTCSGWAFPALEEAFSLHART
jgi:hypothetical protein